MTAPSAPVLRYKLLKYHRVFASFVPGTAPKLTGQNVSIILSENLEHVQIFMLRRKRVNFVLGKADFAGIAGSYVEKSNAA